MPSCLGLLSPQSGECGALLAAMQGVQASSPGDKKLAGTLEPSAADESFYEVAAVERAAQTHVR
jgi:hypothetical protein